jgi:hypothetical protein
MGIGQMAIYCEPRLMGGFGLSVLYESKNVQIKKGVDQLTLEL